MRTYAASESVLPRVLTLTRTAAGNVQSPQRFCNNFIARLKDERQFLGAQLMNAQRINIFSSKSV